MSVSASRLPAGRLLRPRRSLATTSPACTTRRRPRAAPRHTPRAAPRPLLPSRPLRRSAGNPRAPRRNAPSRPRQHQLIGLRSQAPGLYPLAAAWEPARRLQPPSAPQPPRPAPPSSAPLPPLRQLLALASRQPLLRMPPPLEHHPRLAHPARCPACSPRQPPRRPPHQGAQLLLQELHAGERLTMTVITARAALLLSEE
jgi:hypothetical protein